MTLLEMIKLKHNDRANQVKEWSGGGDDRGKDGRERKKGDMSHEWHHS